MQKHRKFFVNLSHCRGILESLEGHLDCEARAQHSVFHNELHARASMILDKVNIETLNLNIILHGVIIYALKYACSVHKAINRRLNQ